MSPSPEGHRLQAIHVWVLSSLAALLVAASVPSLVQIRRASGEQEFVRVRTQFARQIGEVHRNWMLGGSTAKVVDFDGSEVRVNDHGWPVLEPEGVGAQTAMSLVRLLLPQQDLNAAWSIRDWTQAERSSESDLALFELGLPGGGAFIYDEATGRVYDRSLE